MTVTQEAENQQRIDALIALATQTLRPHTTPDGYDLGDVASALMTEDGRTFVGVCIDTT